ncbi:MAG TPA: hypothetical protein PKH24_17560, partial [Sedimentisphaerales bacterium]|nr:hypothetical protein [Sedimentisphaerales bacterium]HNU30761.1 hypothetical protein [Sedimentisphaerales bacterium]
MKHVRLVRTNERISVLSLSALALLALLSATASASPVTNGDFEIPDVSVYWLDWPNHSAGESFGGWTVGAGDVDHVGRGSLVRQREIGSRWCGLEVDN